MKLPNQLKRILSFLLALVMVLGMMPVHVHAADNDQPIDAAVIFTDLHSMYNGDSSTGDKGYKQTKITNMMTALKNTGLPISSVHSGGDAFSSNESQHTGYTDTITGYIQNVLGKVPVGYVWSDHDRGALDNASSKKAMDKTSHLSYGAGADGVYGTADDDNYYVYYLSMGDLCSYDRYKAGFNYTQSNNSGRVAAGFTPTVAEAIANFRSDAAKLDKSKPLFIISHQPLFDNRNDNAWAEDWFDAINAVAAEMDVAFFYGHNHKYDKAGDYYYAKGSQMPVATADKWNWDYDIGEGYLPSMDLSSENKTLNFTHMCGGYFDPDTTGSTSSTTRSGTVVVATIYEDSIRYTTYNKNGVYTGNYALDETVARDHAVTEPDEPAVPETTVPAPTVPSEPDDDKPGTATEAETVYVLVDAPVDGGKYLIVNQTLTNGDLSKDWDADDDGMAVVRNGDAIDYAYAIPQEGTITDKDGNVYTDGYIEYDNADAVWTANASGSGWTLSNGAYYLTTSGSDGVAASKTALVWNYNAAEDDGRLYNGSAYLYFTYYNGNKDNWRWRTGSASGTSSTRDIFFYREVEVMVPDEEPEIPDSTVPEVPSEPEVPSAPDEPEATVPVYEGTGYLDGGVEGLGAASSSIASGTYYYLVNTKANKTLTGTANGNRLTMSGSQDLANVNRWYITHVSGNTYYVQYGGPDGKYLTVGNDSAALTTARTALTLTYNGSYSCWDIGLGNYHLNDYRAEHNYASGYTAGASSDNGSRWAFYPVVTVTTYYELDTDGLDYGSEHKYLIVSNDQAVALKSNGSNTTTQAVTIQNGIITNTDANLEWYFLRNSSKTGSTTYDTLITQNGDTWLYHTNGNMYIGNGGDAHRGYWKLDNYRNGSYCFGDQDYNIWYLYHNGSTFNVRSNNTSTYVRLYKKMETGNGEKVLFTVPGLKAAILPGEKAVLNGTVTVNGETVALSKCTITWSSSDNAIATVSGGTVTGVAGGNAAITATLTAVNGIALKENIVLTVPVTVQGHNYKAVVTEPTCTEKGYTTYTCECGDSYIADEVAALGHDYKAVTNESTCTEDGSIVYTCHCGDSYTKVLPATGHNYKAVVTAPTCTEKGYTTYTCECGDSYIADEVAALGHDYKSVTNESTCTENGSVVYTCACGDTYTEVIPAIGHKHRAVVTAPTCETAGYTTYICACGHSYVADQVAALGHDIKTVVTAPTCTEEGYTTHTCLRCGEVTVDSFVAALGHDYKSVTTAATCTKDGATVYTCHCGDTYTEIIAALGHKYETVITVPTCGDAGFTTYTCHCGHSYVADQVAALGHDYKSVTTAATCTKDGATVYTCHCGDTYTEVIPALGHKYETVVTAPACETAGYTTYTCHCGDSFADDYIEPTGHSYSCTESGGYLIYTCHCGDAYSESGSWIAISFARLAGEGIQRYTHDAGATVSTVLDKVSIQLSTDGVSVSGTVAVTPDMVTWNKTFDGAAVGTYTANITYNGMMLGTVTVTITGGRAYEYAATETSFGAGDSDSEQSISYTQVSDISADEDYVITVYSDGGYYALSHSGNSISAVQVTVSDGEITSRITEDLLWTYEDGKLSYVDGGKTYCLYTYSSGWWWGTPTLEISADVASQVSLGSSKLKIGDYYLRYSSNGFSANSSGTTICLFREK